MAQPEVLDKLYSVKLILPVNPGQHHNTPENSIGLYITNIRRVHKDQFEEFLQYNFVDKAFKSLIIAAVDESHVRTLCNKHAGNA